MMHMMLAGALGMDQHAKVTNTLELDITILEQNPFMSAADLDAVGMPGSTTSCDERDMFQACRHMGEVGSGLTLLGMHNGRVRLAGVTDNGPDAIKCEDLTDAGMPGMLSTSEGRGFQLPTFSPTFMEFEVDSAFGSAVFTKITNMKTTAGTAVTGKSNDPSVYGEIYGPGCNSNEDFDAGGLDPEDLALMPGGTVYVMVEEYSPSVFFVDRASGKVLSRYVPAGVAVDAMSAHYPSYATLPGVLKGRRANRGFEGVALMGADKTTVVAMMQSPMYRGEDQSSMQMRVITMDVRRATQPARAALRGPHLSVC